MIEIGRQVPEGYASVFELLRQRNLDMTLHGLRVRHIYPFSLGGAARYGCRQCPYRGGMGWCTRPGKQDDF